MPASGRALCILTSFSETRYWQHLPTLTVFGGWANVRSFLFLDIGNHAFFRWILTFHAVGLVIPKCTTFDLASFKGDPLWILPQNLPISHVQVNSRCVLFCINNRLLGKFDLSFRARENVSAQSLAAPHLESSHVQGLHVLRVPQLCTCVRGKGTASPIDFNAWLQATPGDLEWLRFTGPPGHRGSQATREAARKDCPSTTRPL